MQRANTQCGRYAAWTGGRHAAGRLCEGYSEYFEYPGADAVPPFLLSGTVLVYPAAAGHTVTSLLSSWLGLPPSARLTPHRFKLPQERMSVVRHAALP